MMAHDTPLPIGWRVSAAFLHSSLTWRVNTRAEPTMIQSQSLQLTKIFLSSTIWAHGHHHGAPFAFGRQHYSYEVARRKFATALHHLGLEIHDVPRPEIYAAPVSRQFLSGNCCHLIFKSTEWIRLLKGVKNIACVAWEFDRLIAPTRGSSHPFKDMRRMLMLPDEVWTPCEFTRQVFQANGIRNVHRIPAPISVPPAPVPIQFPEIPPDLDRVSWINLRVGFGRYRDLNRSVPSRPYRLSDIILDYYQGRQPQIFVSVLNPHDLRKNLTSLIGGFLEFHAENPNSLLLLKLVVDNTSDHLNNVLTGILTLRISQYELIDSNGIWLTTAYLPEPVLGDLYRFSSAYVCTSLAEGQNLPLQEAMAWGLVPITTRHTAMVDYISESNAVVISSRSSPIERPDTAMGSEPDATWHVCTSADVALGLRSFAALSEARRWELGSRARATIARHFSVEPVARLIQSRLMQQQ
jgi:glycosyltransferase involved in cell wall biosynthesis